MQEKFTTTEEASVELVQSSLGLLNDEEEEELG